MSPARPASPGLLSLAWVWVWMLGLALIGPAGCSGSAPGPRPLLTGEARGIAAADPSRSPHHGWDAIDRAVKAGAIEHVVVATPAESIGTRFRTYRLLGPRDQPGELVAERTAQGLDLRVRIGRFGDPGLETLVLESVRLELGRP